MSNYQSEAELERNLIDQMIADGYEYVEISNTDELYENFRKQISKHNINELKGKELSKSEFEKLCLKIEGKTENMSARLLRELIDIQLDDNSKVYIELLNKKDWCKNEFQITHQITNKLGKYENRYDVTILINGLPLVQIELKRRGVDFKQAFDQVVRYKRTSLEKSLFPFIQFFIISNGNDTKYFANNQEMNFLHTFFWTDRENRRMDTLQEFQWSFLQKCHLAKMISRYMVIPQSNRNIMIMRPYQVHAVEALMQMATETNNNAYVWHTTGSGKTLTSFKLSQLLSDEPSIQKVIFLVDRKDLDSQTVSEFNKFQEGSVDNTDNTETLVKYLADPTKKIVLTTIQKMSKACVISKYNEIIQKFYNQKIVFIIDECHRSQFGSMYNDINKKFPNAQYFGFTGTPRFVENKSQDGRTTADIFNKMVHSYLIKDAIKDGNVLGFSLDYVKTINTKWDEEDDTKVEAIDTDEVLMADQRIDLIAKHIVDNHKIRTKDIYNALFTVKSVPMLIKYYKAFQKINNSLTPDKKLRISAIYTYGQNEDMEGKTESSREELDNIIRDYNKMYSTNFSTSTFEEYFRDISNKIKNNQIDIVIVVNMFLTGFDSKKINTLYVDKKLKDHNLIQAFSRTNRIDTRQKDYGNIVCYQTTKKNVDDAIKLFSNTDDTDVVLARPYSEYLDEFKKYLIELRKLYSSPKEIEIGASESKEKEFIGIFGKLIKTRNSLENFVEFSFEKSIEEISQQEYEDYLGKYLDIAKRAKKQSASILNDVEYFIDLIRRDKINVDYIMAIIKTISNDLMNKNQEKINDILALLNKPNLDDRLYYKSELIKSFVLDVMPTWDKNYDVEEEFQKFVSTSKEQEISNFAKHCNLEKEKLEHFISFYGFNGFHETNEINESLKNNNYVKKIKEQQKILTFLRARKIVQDEITNFIEQLTLKYD